MTTRVAVQALLLVGLLTAPQGAAATSPAAEVTSTVIRARAAAAETVLVARRDLARGVALTAADIDTVVTPTTRHRSSVVALTSRPSPGWVTRRVVRAGEPLRRPTVAPPALIATGAPVTVVWETNGLRVSREGTALGAAMLGERVLVRVDATRRVTGTASAPGVVTIVAP